MTKLLYPFILLSALGLVLSLVVHLASLLGLSVPSAAMSLHIGIFVVWLPTIVVAHFLTREFKQRDYWKAALRGCPLWLRYLMYGCCAYALVNFIIFMVNAPPGGARPAGGVVVRGFSGHWMAFYSAALAVLVSAVRVRQHDPVRRCPLGHPVGPSATYCEQCGNPILRDT